MAGEEVFTANAILTIPIIAVFLAIYIYNRDAKPSDAKSLNIHPLIADAALIGIFLFFLYAIRVQERAWKTIDPVGGMDAITGAIYQVFIWLLVILSAVLILRIVLNVWTMFQQRKWDSYGKQ